MKQLEYQLEIYEIEVNIIVKANGTDASMFVMGTKNNLYLDATLVNNMLHASVYICAVGKVCK